MDGSPPLNVLFSLALSHVCHLDPHVSRVPRITHTHTHTHTHTNQDRTLLFGSSQPFLNTSSRFRALRIGDLCCSVPCSCAQAPQQP